MPECKGITVTEIKDNNTSNESTFTPEVQNALKTLDKITKAGRAILEETESIDGITIAVDWNLPESEQASLPPGVFLPRPGKSGLYKLFRMHTQLLNCVSAVLQMVLQPLREAAAKAKPEVSANESEAKHDA